MTIDDQNHFELASEEIITPEEMRDRIEHYQFYCPLVKACFSLKQKYNLDELDAMTLIAFHALI